MRNRIDWDRLVPPGKNGHLQKRWLTGGLWAAGIWAVLAFTINYFEQIAFLELAHQRTGRSVCSIGRQRICGRADRRYLYGQLSDAALQECQRYFF